MTITTVGGRLILALGVLLGSREYLVKLSVDMLPPATSVAQQTKQSDRTSNTQAIATVKQTAKQSNPGDYLPAVPLDREAASNFLDIRGVGDSGMALTHQQPLKLNQKLPEGGTADFGKMLDRFDRTGKSYRGDLSFINWETVVGTQCNRFWASKSTNIFAFITHPNNLIEAYKRGFNLIGLANNHSRDCPSAENGINGALGTARHLERLSREMSPEWMWHGVGTQKAAQIKTYTIKGRNVKVAFASLYMGGGDCTYIACVTDENKVLRSLRDADADIRILAIHSWNNATQQQLVNTGIKFIRNFNGDIVFGHGPHKYQPVRIVRSPSGKQGVLFESLGNFIHPNLSAKRDNAIGRVLFDLDTLGLRQVQIIPVALDGAYASFSGAPNPTSFSANVNWQPVNDPTWRSGVSNQARGAYSNIKQ